MEPNKILLTGSKGFVGSNIEKVLKTKGHSFWAPTSSEVDLLDYQSTISAIGSYQPDLILHCAGKVGGIQDNIRHPYDYLYKNSQISLNLIEAARRFDVKSFLNIASTCMYPVSLSSIKEENLLGGPLEQTNEGYALSKILALKLCEITDQSSEILNYKTLAPTNLFGPFDTLERSRMHLISAIIAKCLDAQKAGNKVVVWGDGSARREFLYVETFVSIIMTAIQKLDQLPSYVNIGAGFDLSVLDYYKIVTKQIKMEPDFEFDLSKPTGVKQKSVDCRLQKKLGLFEHFDLESSVNKTIQYYRENLNV